MRILITGSSDGLGLLTAKHLLSQNKTHQIILHARNSTRANDAKTACPAAYTTIIGDLGTLAGIRALAKEAEKHAPYDAIMHNAGLFRGPFNKTEDGLPVMVTVNSVAPYMLSCLMSIPTQRLIFVSSGLHTAGNPDLKDLAWRERGEGMWNDMQAYSDSKLHNVMLARAFERHYDIPCLSVSPGWVKTKMGGEDACDDLDVAVETFAMVLTGEGEAGKARTGHWFGKKEIECKQEAEDVETQEKLLKILEDTSGVAVPKAKTN
jgi:NAD(P)-dependent dehydrogenase (short-subunit alcohol dehydrogenase family)